LIITISGSLRASVLEATKEIGVVEVLKKPITPASVEAGRGAHSGETGLLVATLAADASAHSAS
jgi:hypothetical protein